jgi:hypothetical protein
MHGSPLSRINNLDLWQTHDYRDLGIAGEPYLDVDFTQVFYLTDTGHLMELARDGQKEKKLEPRRTRRTRRRAGLISG